MSDSIVQNVAASSARSNLHYTAPYTSSSPYRPLHIYAITILEALLSLLALKEWFKALLRDNIFNFFKVHYLFLSFSKTTLKHGRENW
jgi:hypothetical protein